MDEYVNLIRELQEMKQTKANIERQKEKVRDVIKKLQLIETTVNEIKEIVMPTINFSIGKQRKPIKQYIDEMYEKMLNGTKVTMDLVKSTYPELDDNSKRAYYVIRMLKEKPKVDFSKDGATVTLFIR